MQEIYNIGDVVKKLNINKETIRYYEKIGLLTAPVRDKNGYRLYTKTDIENIKVILIIKQFGFSLNEINMLLHDEILCGDIENIKKIVKSKVDEIDNEINKLNEKKKLLEKVNRNILDKNIEHCEDVEKYLKNNS